MGTTFPDTFFLKHLKLQLAGVQARSVPICFCFPKFGCQGAWGFHSALGGGYHAAQNFEDEVVRGYFSRGCSQVGSDVSLAANQKAMVFLMQISLMSFRFATWHAIQTMAWYWYAVCMGIHMHTSVFPIVLHLPKRSVAQPTRGLPGLRPGPPQQHLLVGLQEAPGPGQGAQSPQLHEELARMRQL